MRGHIKLLHKLVEIQDVRSEAPGYILFGQKESIVIPEVSIMMKACYNLLPNLINFNTFMVSMVSIDVIIELKQHLVLVLVLVCVV